MECWACGKELEEEGLLFTTSCSVPKALYGWTRFTCSPACAKKATTMTETKRDRELDTVTNLLAFITDRRVPLA